jgi:Spy/CpxP family protein refolding chaperone
LNSSVYQFDGGMAAVTLSHWWRITMIHIRTALAAGMLVVGGAAIAAAQQSPPATTPQAHAQSGRHMREGFGPRMRGQLFKGITLSDAEKSNIKNVQAKYAPQMKALREQFRPQLQAAREARQRGDSAALKAMWQKSAAQREQTKNLLDAERNDLRGALTPENQVKFDANVKQFEQRVAQHAGKAWKKGGRSAAPRA